VNITDEQVRREFLRRHGERLVLRQIVVKTREEAEELHKQLTAGASFDELAKTKSTDARTRIEGGKLREPLARGKAPNFTYEDVAFHLSLGQISSPFEVEGQWYILKLEEKLPPADVKFEDVKEKYRQELAAREEMTSRDALLRELFQKAKIERGRFVAPPAEGPGGKPASPPADTSPPTPPESKGAAP
jgi:peptidyl-prolyl cis-trans isomerase C